MATHSPIKITLIVFTLLAFVLVAAINALAATSDGGGKNFIFLLIYFSVLKIVVSQGGSNDAE